MPAPSTTLLEPAGTSVPIDPAWDEAFLRVESYLRAHHVESRILLNALATEIIHDAKVLATQQPAAEPVALAMAVTHARIGAWFACAAQDSDWTNERDRARGRLTLAITKLPGRPSSDFLLAHPVPPELTAAMASFQFHPGPELRFSNMPTAPLEFGFDETATPQAVRQRLRQLVRAAASWLIVVGLIGVAWAASH